MGLKGRIAGYVGVGVLLLLALDPRTWGESVNTGSGDEVGIVLGATFLASVGAAITVLTVIVLVVESATRARERRRSFEQRETQGPDAHSNRSWYA